MLKILDIFLSVIHLGIVFFNLFGWIPKRTRKMHFVSILLTAASWFILGIWFGTGYCPFTDWQWDVKTQLGETNLPGNFVEYFLEKIFGYNFSPAFVNTLVGVLFLLAALMSVYVNFVLPALKRRRSRS